MNLGVRPAGVTIANQIGIVRSVPILLSATVAALVLPVLAVGTHDWSRWAMLILAHGPAVAAYLTVVVVALAWPLCRACRLGVRFDDHGVMVRTFWRTDRYSWPEVNRFADGCTQTWAGAAIWALSVVLANGRTIMVTATARKKSASPAMMVKIAQVAACYQIPAELTGDCVTHDGTPPGADPVAADAAAGQPAEPRTSTRRALVLPGISVALLAVAAIIAALIHATSSRQLAEDQLRPGDCLTGSNLGLQTSDPWPDLVTAVPCAHQHIAEVFFAGNAWPTSPTAYPGDDSIGNAADNRCDQEFARYDGISPDASELAITEVVPDSDTWSGGDRFLTCVAYKATQQHPGGAPVSHSIRGSGQ